MQNIKVNTVWESDNKSGKTIIKLLSYPRKDGKATVKVLKSGVLCTKDGAVERGFQFQYGALKFDQVGGE